MIYLSIIIPHYNSTATLLKLLKSIPNTKEIQVIVVDDHSDEQEKQDLLDIKEANIFDNVYFFENDLSKKGAGSSRNVGLEKAVGEWVLFADSDDFFLEGFYSIVKEYFNSNFDVVFFKPTSIDLE